MRQPRSLIVVLLVGTLATVTALACRDEATTGLDVPSVQLAKRVAQDSAVITATDPTGAPQDTTLDVEVSGSGFDDGSTVELTLAGVPTEKVRTNSTRYRNSRTLIANITIAADAQVNLYDVEVTPASSKKGIGTEMFEVFYKVKSAPTATVDFLEPGPEDSPEAYNLQSPAQAMWGENNSRKWPLNLNMEPFALTLAFSQADLDPSTWAGVTDPDKRAECAEVSRRLAYLQGQPQPLVGSFEFVYDTGRTSSSATVWFDVVVDGFKYNISSWSCTTCLRKDGQPELTVSEGVQGGRPTYTLRVAGGGVTIHKTPADGPPGKGEEDPQSCGQELLDYVLIASD